MHIRHEVPDTQTYQNLRIAAGLPPKEHEIATTALNRSIFTVIVRKDGSEMIGMGRIVGDGGCYYQLVDVLVHPDYEDLAVKEVVIRELLNYLDQHAPADAEIIVMADVRNLPIYQNHGFKLVYPEYYGMTRQSVH
ncbi:GNAT family N-acetyltransferase [Paenibacillus sp. HJGM_3]|uniref:GNAT family N-acetyltransferase n=1 Tax=Paenibacillus sp. HJGM_3 TaxID=3379816 RepID=UPI00385B19FC